MLLPGSLAVYVIVVTPGLKVVFPTKLIPVAGDVPVVVPVIAQVTASKS
jgi:hypothetical protein